MNARSFLVADSRLRNRMLNEGKKIHPARWQGIDIAARPDAEMVELLNVDLDVDLRGIEDLNQWRVECQPNVPWADDHFAERVSGEPLNPPPSWARWPWAKSADKFREYQGGPVRSAFDWGYLAGLIDGEGSISQVNSKQAGATPHPRIKITQVDRDFLTRVQQKFGVGTLREYSNKSNALSSRGSLIWRINKREEVRWVLHNVIPFMDLKKHKAQEALASLRDADARFANQSPARLGGEMFNHTYPERFWASQHRGIRHTYGDLNDVVELMRRDPLTRQAYLPIFFPEDTGVGDGGRKPCTLGYQFIVRDMKLHIYYPMRSCDLLRHFRDDCYLTVRLALWVLEQLRTHTDDEFNWNAVTLGSLSMHMTSLHCFIGDYMLMQQEQAALLLKALS